VAPETAYAAAVWRVTSCSVVLAGRSFLNALVGARILCPVRGIDDAMVGNHEIGKAAEDRNASPCRDRGGPECRTSPDSLDSLERESESAVVQ